MTTAGNVTATGNALGLSKESGANGPGTADSIGTFSALGGGAMDDAPANPSNAWFAGTTNDWTENGAEADLVLPDDAEVLHAELIWGGSSFYGTEDVRPDLDTPVTLSFGGDDLLVSPDAATELSLEETSSMGFAANYYMRSADVTAFVAEHHTGTYATLGVPATQDTPINQSNAAGWTLVVAYRDSAQPIRNLTIFVGGSFVDEDATEDYDISGFCTPPQGAFSGNIIVSAMEGDASRTGDSLAIQAASGEFVALMGDNNPLDNFFCSQINDADEQLDTSGTFGDRNHDADNGINVEGGRQGWDITRVDVSSGENHLSNGQTSTTIRTQTDDDSYVPTLVAFGIEVNAPDFTGAGGDANPTALEVDDISAVTIDMENVGLVDATALLLTAPLPEGLELESFSIDGTDGDINGNMVDAAGLAAGVSIGDVGVDVARQIVIEVRSSGAPTDPSGQYLITPGWNYDYVSCAGEDAATEPHALPEIAIDFLEDSGGTGTGGAESSGDSGDEETGDSASDSMSGSASITVTVTDSDSGTGNGSASDSASAGQATPDSGCGCRTQGSGSIWALGLLGLAFLRRRR